MGNYIAARVGVSYAELGYSDIYNTQNAVQLKRNLSFNSSVWEVALQGDFNFFALFRMNRVSILHPISP